MKKLLYLLLTATVATTVSLDGMKRPGDDQTEQPAAKKAKTDADATPVQQPAISLTVQRVADGSEHGSVQSLEYALIQQAVDNICNGDLTIFYSEAPSDMQEKIILHLANPATYESFAEHLKTIDADILDLILEDKVFFAMLQSLCASITLDQFAEYLRTVCSYNHVTIVKTIFAIVGSDTAGKVCSIQNDSYTALHIATFLNHTKIVKLILALPNASQLCLIQDNNGNMALQFAALNGHTEIVKLILEQPNADQLCTIKNNRGGIALHSAAYKGYTEIVKLILEQPNAKLLCSIQANAGSTPLDLATNQGHIEVAELLKEKMQ